MLVSIYLSARALDWVELSWIKPRFGTLAQAQPSSSHMGYFWTPSNQELKKLIKKLCVTSVATSCHVTKQLHAVLQPTNTSSYKLPVYNKIK